MSVCPGCDKPYSSTDGQGSLWQNDNTGTDQDNSTKFSTAFFALSIVYAVMLLVASICFCIFSIRRNSKKADGTWLYLAAITTAIISNALASLAAGINLSGITVTNGFFSIGPITNVFTQASLLLTILVYAIVARMSRLEKILITAGLATWLIICFAIETKWTVLSVNDTTQDLQYWTSINHFIDMAYYGVASIATLGVLIRTGMRHKELHRGIVIPAATALLGILAWCSLQISLDQSVYLQDYGLPGFLTGYIGVAEDIIYLLQVLALLMIPLLFWHVNRLAQRNADIAEEYYDKPTAQPVSSGDWERA